MVRQYNYLLDKIFQLQAQGRYTFSFEEMLQVFPIGKEALKKSLLRLSRKGYIVSVRKGFYVIVPPEYASQKILPPILFIDSLMEYLNKRYYVGLLSAAEIHGAAHAQPQVFQVITPIPALRSLKARQYHIQFFSKRTFQDIGIIRKKTDTGYVNVSSPELTLLDLMQFRKRIGGLKRVVTIMEELVEECRPSQMQLLLSKGGGSIANLQRVGYVLDIYLGQRELANVLLSYLKNKKIYPIHLKSSKSEKKKNLDRKWYVYGKIER